MRRDFLSSYNTRRSYERYNLNDSATLILDSKIEKSSILRDLSARGVGFICDFPLKINEKIQIIIKSSLFKNLMYKDASVVWCNKIEGNLYRAGLDFGIDNKVDFNN